MNTYWLAEETRWLVRDKIQPLLGPFSLIFPFFSPLGGEAIVASGSLKVFVISAIQTQKQQVSGRCTLPVVATPFHLGLRLFLFFGKNGSIFTPILAPKLWSASWYKQHEGTYFHLQCKGWYLGERLKQHQMSLLPATYFTLLYFIVFPMIWFPIVWRDTLVCSDTISRIQPRKKEPILCRVDQPPSPEILLTLQTLMARVQPCKYAEVNP